MPARVLACLPLCFEAGIGWLFGEPAVAKEFRARSMAGAGASGPWRSHLAFATYFW